MSMLTRCCRGTEAFSPPICHIVLADTSGIGYFTATTESVQPRPYSMTILLSSSSLGVPEPLSLL